MELPRFLVPLNKNALTPVNSVLVINPTDDWYLDQLGKSLTLEQDDAILNQYLSTRGLNVFPRVEDGIFDRALIILGKYADANRAMIGRAWRLVHEGGDILIEGTKTDGVNSIIRHLKTALIPLEAEPKSHGKIIWLKRHLTATINISEWEKADLPFMNRDGYYVRKGIFSSEKVDAGTAFFLENFRGEAQGQVADFGGGYGVIAKYILAQSPKVSTLDLFETSALACNLAKQNIEDPRLNVHWQDVGAARPRLYDLILSNPPFHNGNLGDPEIGRRFITTAAKALRARGSFIMVANRHLPYEQHLRSCFGQVEVVAENSAYKIFNANRPNS